MSVSVSIELALEGLYEEINPQAIFDKLVKAGWQADDHGGVTYLPAGDVGDFGWENKSMTPPEIRRLISQKVEAEEIVGISLIMQPENAGGLLVFPKKNLLSFSPSINRIKLENSQCTDFGWYIERLVPALSDSSNTSIISITTTEIR